MPNLLAAARLAGMPLSTRGKRLRAVAVDLGFAHAERSPNIGMLNVDLEHA